MIEKNVPWHREKFLHISIELKTWTIYDFEWV